MKKIFLALALLILVLLLGSFPVRNLYGSTFCDGMRLLGFLLLIVYCSLRIKHRNEK